MQVNKNKLKSFKDLQFKTVLYAIFVLTVIISSVLIIKLSIIEKDEETQTVNTYIINSSVNYSVRYAPNNFFEERILGMNRQYASDLVSIIEVDFGSNLRLTKEALIEYNYEVTGLITGTYSSDSSRKETELWTKNFTYLEPKSGSISKKTNSINEKIELDFNEYNNIVSEFKRQLRLNIDGKFTIKMLVNYRIITKEETVSKTEELTLEFPLNKAAFDITTKEPAPQKNSILTTYDGELVINYPVLVAAIIFLMTALVLLTKFIMRLRELARKTEYQKELNKILKNYGDIIVESKTPVDAIKYEILEITDFNDMVDIENEVRIPIIYYEKTPDMEGWFVLVHGNMLYRYILYIKNSYRPRH